jgi:hypothetical protein
MIRSHRLSPMAAQSSQRITNVSKLQKSISISESFIYYLTKAVGVVLRVVTISRFQADTTLSLGIRDTSGDTTIENIARFADFNRNQAPRAQGVGTVGCIMRLCTCYVSLHATAVSHQEGCPLLTCYESPVPVTKKRRLRLVWIEHTTFTCFQCLKTS